MECAILLSLIVCLVLFKFIRGNGEEPLIKPPAQPQPRPVTKIHHWNDPLRPSAHSDTGETTYNPDPGGSRYDPGKQKPIRFEHGLDRNTPQEQLVWEDMGRNWYVRRRVPGE
jgi:hypothetical protein